MALAKRHERAVRAAQPARDPAEREFELAFWDSVRELDNAESLQAYLDKYPTGEFRALAEIRLKELAESDTDHAVAS